MDIALRFLVVLSLLVIVGCDGSQQTASEDRPTAETAQPTVSEKENDADDADRPMADADATATEQRTDSEASRAPETVESDEITVREPTSTAEPPKSAGPDGPSDEQWQEWAAALAGRGDAAAGRQAAAEALDELAAGGSVDFMKVLGTGSPEARRCAAFFLMDRVDPSDPAIAKPFIAALSDEDGPVRHIALSVVKRFPEETLAGAAPQLAVMVADQSEQAANRAAVARLLGSLEADASQVLPALVRSMSEDPERSVRSACLMAVSRVAAPKDAVTAFQQVLARDAEASVRGLAAVRLGKLGPQATDATADLANALEDRDESVRRKAADALVEIGAPSVPDLTKKLRATDAATRRFAVFALSQLGPAASSSVDELKKRLQDEDEEVRKLADLE